MFGDEEIDEIAEEINALGWLVMPAAVVCGIVVVVADWLGVINVGGL